MTAVADQAPTQQAATYKVAEAAAVLGISPNHYYNLFNRGEVPGRRLGRRVVVPILQLERYLNGEDWA